MSEPAPETAPETAPPRAAPTLLVLARIVVPIALAIVGYAILIAQRWSVAHELQLVAPEAAAGQLPVRAFVFGGIESPDDAAELVEARVAIEIACDGASVARTMLEIGAGPSAEGVIPIDAGDGTGRCELRGTARDARGEVLATARRPLAIVREPARRPLVGRLASELDLRAPPPVLVDVPGEVAPRVDLRVTSGSCVPEEPCEVLVSAPDVERIEIEPTAAATLVSSTRDERLHVLSIVAHGPEAPVTLALLRGGARVAHAELRVPVALATPWVEPTRGAPLRARPPPGRSALIVDLFDRGAWWSTRTIRGEDLELDPGRAGLWRVQVRADPFGGDYVGVHHVLVATEPSDEAIRAALAGEGVQTGDPPGTDWRLLLARAEEEVRELPAAVSGLEADRARLAARRRTVQIVGAIALGLGIVVFLLSLLRRGLRAAEEARAVMVEAGDETAVSRATRMRMTFAVVLFVGAVAVALLAGAALILARAALVAP